MIIKRLENVSNFFIRLLHDNPETNHRQFFQLERVVCEWRGEKLFLRAISWNTILTVEFFFSELTKGKSARAKNIVLTFRRRSSDPTFSIKCFSRAAVLDFEMIKRCLEMPRRKLGLRLMEDDSGDTFF